MSSGMVDTKTVEMRFDNQDFEKNCKQSISTLDKLKAALKLDGASKGLSDIEKQAKKLNMKDLESSVDSVGKKFSALETIATGVFLKIGMSAVDAGAKIVKSLTFDQLASGWSKYEEKTTAVQTIMSNLTAAEGEFIDDAAKMEYVNGYLEKLMWFSDETSYSFTDMTSNVGKFIANGQNLSDSVTAMQGIATWAAKSGQNTQAAARAMYNISQAMGTGSMKVKDWMSIENANMATAEFKQLAITIGENQGKLKKGQVAVEQFRDSLSGKDTKDWFDKDVMMEVFETYGAAADRIQQLSEETGKTATEVIKDLKNSAEESDKAFVDSLGFKAFAAAQEAKTFREAIAATSDAVSTKWMRIFEGIFGNYLQQKELWTGLAEDLWDIFAGPLDTVSDVLDAWNTEIEGVEKSGRELLISGVKNVFDTLFHSYTDKDGKEFISLFGSIKKAFQGVFFAGETAESVGKKLKDLTARFHDFSERLKDFLYNPETNRIKKIQNAFEGLFRIFKIGGKLVSAIVTPFKELLQSIIPGGLSGVIDLADDFGTLMKNFEEFLDEIGVFEAISDGIRWCFSKIGEGVDWLSKKLSGLSFKDLLKKAKLKISDFFQNTDFKTIFQTIGSYFSNIIEQIKIVNTDKLPEKLTPLQNFFIGLKNIFNGFKTFFSYISPAFKFIGEKINNFFTSIGDAFKNKKLGNSVSRFQPIFDGLKSIFGGIGDFFASVGPTLKKIGDWIGQALGKIGEGIAKFAENKSAAEIMQTILKGGLFISLTNFINSLAGLNRGGKGILKSISGDLDAIKGVLKAYQREINVATLVDLALAIGILSASMWVLAQIPAERMDQVGDALLKLAEVLAGFTILKEVIKSLTKANAVIEGKDPDSLFGKIKSIFTGVVQTSIFANDASAKFVKIMAGVMFAAIAAKKIAEAISIFGEAMIKLGKEQDDSAIKKGGKIVAQIVAVFGMFALLAGFTNKTGSALAAALAMFIVVKAVAKLVNLLAEIGSDAAKLESLKKVVDTFSGALKEFAKFLLLFVAIVALAEIIMAAVAGAGSMTGLAGVLKQFGKNFMRIAASLAIVAAAVWMMSKIEYTKGDIANCAIIFGGFIALVGALQIILAWVAKNNLAAITQGQPLARILRVFGNNFLKIAASLLIVALAVKLCAGIEFGEGDALQVGLIFGIFLLLVGIIAALAVGLSGLKSASQGKIIAALAGTAGLLIAAAASLFLVEEAVRLMQGLKLSPTDAVIIGAIFGGFLTIVGLFGTLAGALTKTWSGATAIAALAGSYIAAAYALQLVAGAFMSMKSMTNLGQLATIGLIFAAFIGLVGGLGYLVGDMVTNWQGVAAMAVLAGSYIAAAYALQLVAGAFTGMMAVADSGNMAAIGIVFGAFLVAVGAFGLLAASIATDYAAVAGMGVMLLSYIAAAYALQIVAEAMNAMCQITNPGQLEQACEIMTRFMILVGLLAAIGGALGAFGGIDAVLGMAAVAGIIAAIGIACLAAGAGIGLCADALANLVEAIAVYGPEAAANIKDLLNALLDAVISTAPKMAVAAIAVITALALGLIGAAPVLAAAAFTVLITLLDTFATGIPALANSIVNLIASALNTIANVIRASSYLILPAVMNILSAIVELVLEVLAELVGLIPGVGTSLAGEIRGWKGDVNEALTDVFSDAERIGTEGAESVLTGFSGGGVGKSFSETGKEKGKELTDSLNKEIDTAGKTTTKDATTDFMGMLNKYMSDGSADGVDTFNTDFLAQITGSIGDFDLGGLMEGKMGGMLSSITSGGEESSSAFSGLLDSLGVSMDDWPIGEKTATKMSEVTAAIEGEKEPAATAANGVATSVESEITSLDSKSWGADLAAQYAAGIEAGKPKAIAAAEAIAAAVRAILHFSEPDVGPLSDFHTYAPDMIKLWCKGIYDNLGQVEDSSASMADTVYDGFSTALEYVSDLINDGMSDELAIRPVMDLSEIQNGLHNLDSMIGGANGYSLSGTAKLAASAASGFTPSASVNTAPAEANAAGPINNYNTFNITNNDPTAVAEKVSRLIGQETKRAQAVWAR